MLKDPCTYLSECTKCARERASTLTNTQCWYLGAQSSRMAAAIVNTTENAQHHSLKSPRMQGSARLDLLIIEVLPTLGSPTTNTCESEHTEG
jgi:hypothetical protein